MKHLCLGALNIQKNQFSLMNAENELSYLQVAFWPLGCIKYLVRSTPSRLPLTKTRPSMVEQVQMVKVQELSFNVRLCCQNFRVLICAHDTRAMSLVSLVIMWRRMWPYHSIIQRFQNAATTIFYATNHPEQEWLRPRSPGADVEARSRAVGKAVAKPLTVADRHV